ncbi:MAG: zinc ribbon domain-containing protein [Candidatus Eremiobacterota bacterium]
MGVICHICDYENSDESPFCEKCGERLREVPANKYDMPIKMLRDIGNSLADRQMSGTQEKVEEAFNDIMEISQTILDEAQKDLERNLSVMDTMSDQVLDELGEVDEGRSLEVFSNFVSQFQSAQDQINEGLSIAKEALQKMRSFSELEAGSGKIDLERAASLLQGGLNTLEFISEESQEPLFLEYEDIKPVPPQIMESMDQLEEIMSMMSDYMDTGDRENLVEIIASFDMAKDSIQDLLDSTGDEQINKEDETIPIGYRRQLKHIEEEKTQDKGDEGDYLEIQEEYKDEEENQDEQLNSLHNALAEHGDDDTKA